jgi:hypothetical protein
LISSNELDLFFVYVKNAQQESVPHVEFIPRFPSCLKVIIAPQPSVANLTLVLIFTFQGPRKAPIDSSACEIIVPSISSSLGFALTFVVAIALQKSASKEKSENIENGQGDLRLSVSWVLVELVLVDVVQFGAAERICQSVYGRVLVCENARKDVGELLNGGLHGEASEVVSKGTSVGIQYVE